MRKIIKRFAFLVCMLCTLSAHGQPKHESIIKIWAGVENPRLNKARVELTAFYPDSTKSNGSSIIICPGGSYRYLGIHHEGYEIAKWLNSLGFNAFVLRYRLSMHGHHYPAMLQDIQRSIQLVRENAASWHLNANAIGVMGFSAGGHLAGTAAIYYNENFMQSLGIEPKVSLRPDFAVMLYPVVSMHDSIAHHTSKRDLLGFNHTKALENKMSLEDNVHEGMPPIFLMQAKGDKVVDYRNSYYFYKALTAQHLSCKYLLYECGGHGFGIDPKRNKEASQWKYECEKWFETIGCHIMAK
jgi:acetyl esterase/lipase